VPRFRGQGSGTIINTTSVAARHGGGPGALVYAAAKAAVSSLTRGLAKELAPHRIRVNAISPGVVLTPIHERLSSPAVMDAFIRQVPLGRAAAADECVGAFLFLASERLSSYVTGQVLEVNGGQFMP
jgi:3-oxoacyl-[acyl-carrier protein] reductase